MGPSCRFARWGNFPSRCGVYRCSWIAGPSVAQIQFVETHKNDFEDLDRRLVDIVDSVVAGAAKAETRPSPQASAPRTVPMASP